MADKNAKKTSEEPRSAAPAAPSKLAALRQAAFQEVDLGVCYKHFLPLVQEVPEDEAAVFTGRPQLMLHNVEHALAIAEPQFAKALTKMPEAPITESLELPSLLRGLIHAMGRFPEKALSTGEVEGLLREGGPRRAVTLKYLEVASDPEVNLVPEPRVRAIREGKGKLNMAEDFAAIPALFAEYDDKLKGKHPFAPEMLASLAAIGGKLVGQLRPKGASRGVTGRSPEALVRDQFAALARSRYDDLRTLVAVAVGFEKAQDMLPSLQSAYYSAPAEEPEAEGEKPTE